MAGNKPAIIFDTNVLVSAMLTEQSSASLALELGSRMFRLLLSNETLAEFIEVSQRSKFDRFLHKDARTAFARKVSDEAIVIDVAITVQACRDPRDDKFLALAEAGNAMAIVTGDDDLHSMRAWKGIPIVCPVVFLQKWPAAE